MDDAAAADLKRALTLREIVGVSLRLYRAFPVLFAVLALGVVAPYALLELVVSGSGPLASGGGGNAALRGLFELLSTTLVGPLISALHVHAVVAVAEGQTPRLARVASIGVRVLPAVAATEIIANLGISAGLIALVVPGVLLLLRWSVAAQAAAIEREGWLPALAGFADVSGGAQDRRSERDALATTVFGAAFFERGLLGGERLVVEGGVAERNDHGALALVEQAQRF